VAGAVARRERHGTRHPIRGTGAVVRAARRSGVSRIVVQSSYGVGPPRPHLEIAERLVFALLLKPQIADTERQEQVVRASGLEWTLVQPVYLTDTEDDPPVTSTDGRTRLTRVSRRAVAAVHADLVERAAPTGTTPCRSPGDSASAVIPRICCWPSMMEPAWPGRSGVHPAG
jgi:uncharacterized protein YbjT (DUF2867 family)